MDPVRNPYAPGAGSPPPELAGRERERRTFDVLLQRMAAGRPEQSLALWGLRGVGKTVLLNDFASQARERGWGTGYIELRGRGPLRPALAQLAAQAARDLSRREGLRQKARAALAVISSFSLTAMPAGVTFQVEVDPERGRGDSGQLDADLYEVLLELGALASEAGAGVVFLFDEMQFAELEELAALLAAHHRVGQLGLPIAMVGAGLPQLAGRLAEASSYAERLFAYVEVGRLSDAAARDALVIPAEREGVAYRPDALELILGRAERYPFFIQTYGRLAWQVARESPIELADAQNADALAREQLDIGFHRARFNRATPGERRYLAAIAALGEGPQLTAAVSARLGQTQQASAVQRQRLIDVKGLIYSPQRGYVDFTAPLFGDWIRRSHPLDSLI
ncbi:MAG TPA: ATP-binding protein [Miltoncostaeaceae bacterium]|nr:ATP-binding protein [Miltoncostaeaceae bacterium]